MKQEITKEQFDELSGEMQEKLLSWVQEKHYDPYLTIGQMIEFLSEHSDHHYGIDPLSTEGIEHGWMVKRYNPDIAPGWCQGISDDELCDGLWEAVKEVLEQKSLSELPRKDVKKPRRAD